MAEFIHRLRISFKKFKYITCHKILLSSIVDNCTALIKILTIVLEQVIIEIILNSPNVGTVVLHLSLCWCCCHKHQNNRQCQFQVKVLFSWLLYCLLRRLLLFLVLLTVILKFQILYFIRWRLLHMRIYITKI